MSQVGEVVRGALLLLRVTDATEAPEAEDAQDAIRALNLMMRAWEVEGISLGWRDVSTPADELPVPPEAEEVVTYSLALRLRPNYGVALEPDVISRAESGLAMLRAQIASNQYDRLTYDDLPVGQGQRVGAWRNGFIG